MERAERGALVEEGGAGVTEALAGGAALVAGAEAFFYVDSVSSILVAAEAAAETVDALSGARLRGEAGICQDDLAVFIFVSGGCGGGGDSELDLAQPGNSCVLFSQIGNPCWKRERIEG